MMFSRDFSDTQQLFVGTNSEYFKDFETFIHVRSYFGDAWYNYVIPKVKNPTDLQGNLMKEVLVEEAKVGKKVGIYLENTYIDSYREWLVAEGYSSVGDENYISKTPEKIKIDLSEGYQITEDFDEEEMVSVLTTCFEGWEEEADYFKRFAMYRKEGRPHRDFRDYAVMHNDKIIGGGSVLSDTRLGVGYLHNTGILSEHRRKGLFTALVATCERHLATSGITKIIAITDTGAHSTKGFQKMGYEITTIFRIFSKE